MKTQPLSMQSAELLCLCFYVCCCLKLSHNKKTSKNNVHIDRTPCTHNEVSRNSSNWLTYRRSYHRSRSFAELACTVIHHFSSSSASKRERRKRERWRRSSASDSNGSNTERRKRAEATSADQDHQSTRWLLSSLADCSLAGCSVQSPAACHSSAVDSPLAD